MAQSERSGS